MFEIIGYLLSLVLISIVVTIAVEYTKRFKFTETMVNFFNDKVKKLSWYQVESMLIAIVILIILNLLGAVTLGTLAIILNGIVIALLSNGIFTYEIVKIILAIFKITPSFINKN